MMELFKTKDTKFVAALMQKGYKPRERLVEDGDVFFIFDSTEDLMDLQQDFFNNRMEGALYGYATQLKAVKQSVWEALGRQRPAKTKDAKRFELR